MASADVLTPSPGGGGAIDISRLSHFLLLPEDVVSSLAGIAEDYVTSVLRAIDDKAREHHDLQADRLRIEVELEQSVRTADNKVKGMKKQLDSSLLETQDLRTKLTNSESARNTLETELSAYKLSRATDDEESRVLRIRVQSLESDKRDTLEALDRKARDYDRLQEEYTALQSKSIEARREVSSLEIQLQQAQSSQTTAKFKEQNLIQEIELLKKNNEWLDSELSTKVAEFQKFKKEKSIQSAALQRELDDALSSMDMTQRNSDNLKQRFDEVSKKAEDALIKVQDLQNKAVSQEESFRNEMHSQQRLAELFEQSTKSARARVAELERLLEEEHVHESAEIGRARAQAETERAEKESAESRVAQLEVQVERLEADLSVYASGAFITPGSPHGSINGNSTPNRRPGSAMGTPGGMNFASPAAARLQKSGLSITQLYSDYTNMKASFEAEKRRNAKLEQAIEDLMEDLEHKAPEIQDLREEHERLQKSLIEMSMILESASKEQEIADKETRKITSRVKDYERENGVLRQQLRDLSTQIQVLLVEIEHRDSGADPLSASQNQVFEKIIRGELSDENETDTDRLISQRLTVFRSVRELQEQNQKLLKATRELGSKMERDEEERRAEQEGKELKEITFLKGTIAGLQDDLKAASTRAQSFVRERDMFRRMLQNKDNILQSEDEGKDDAAASDAGRSTAQGVHENLGELLRDLQTQYDHFKTEATENYNTLNAQARKLAQEKSELEVHVRRVDSQLELASERYNMLKGNFDMLRSENGELQKRIASLHETQAKQDLTTQKFLADLVDSQSVLESMRNENANLKAEKGLWKNIEHRLAQENESLTQERVRLNGLIANLQVIQGERERDESETRRRLNSLNEKLESEIQQAKRRLNEEIEEAKKIVIRKEASAKEAQLKIDALNGTLSTTRESLVAAQTSQSHLQSRIDELVIQLKSAEEKLMIYQSKPHSAPAPTGADEDEDSVSREQELQVEVAELTKNMDLAKGELEDLKTQIRHYKSIAQSTEEELQNMNEAHDAYKESMEQQATEHEVQIRELTQRLEDVSTELTLANQELSDLRQAELEKRQQFEEERGVLQSQINGLNEDAEKNAAALSFYQEDLRSQARIAQEAQQNYERELVKHAEAAKALQQLREEHSDLKGEVHQIQAEAETAKTTLAASESSWEAQTENYQRELEEVKKRWESLVKQNKILLDQLDNVNTQVSIIQKNRTTLDEGGESEDQGRADRGIEDIKEVLRYLRNEKEIVDVQYELALQESKRLKQQLDYTKSTLDETRLLLAQERQRESDQLRGALQHKDLMEKISQLNLLRESNSALRSDSERKGRKVAELTQKAEELVAKIEPLEEQVKGLEAEKEAKEDQIKLLQQDSEHWKARAQQILQKYDRVDPVELEMLKDKAKALEEKCTALEAERDTLLARLEQFEESKTKELTEAAEVWRSKLSGIVQTTKTKIREVNEKLAVEKKNAVESQEAAEALRAQDQSSKDEIKQLQEEKTRLESDLEAMQAKATEIEENYKNHKIRAQGLVRDMNALKKQYDDAQQEINSLKARDQPAPMPAPDNEAAIEAEVGRRVAVLQSVDTSAIEAEVNRRLGEIQANQPTQPVAAPVDHTILIEAEIARRMDEFRASQPALPPQLEGNSAVIEAEVARRVAETQATVNSAAVEAEVTRRLAEMQAKQDPEPGEVMMTAADVEKQVEERLEKEKGQLERRIDDARRGFQEYKAKAVTKALAAANAEFEKEMTDKDEEHKKQVQALEAIIEQLKKEVEELRQQLEHVQENNRSVTAPNHEEYQKALDERLDLQKEIEGVRKSLKDKELEFQKLSEEVENIKKEEGVRLEEARVEARHEVQAEFLFSKQDDDPAPKKVGTQEDLKSIIKKNVEHRLGKEKEKWQKEVGVEREKDLEERLKKKEEELQASHAALLEKSKDALRQEGAARIKVQLNMLEKKNKSLEEKLKVLESVTTATQHQQPALAVQQAGISPSGQPIGQPQQYVDANQAPVPQLQPPQRRPDGQGTGPAALKSLRGAVSSNIPRGGRGGAQMSGRGTSNQQHQQHPQPPNIAPQQFTSPFGQPGQIGQISPVPHAGLPQPQFSSRPNMPPQQQPQPQLPRPGTFGRGAFGTVRGQGRGGSPLQLQNVQTGLPPQGAPSVQSPSGSRNINPGARQFVPTKRLREDGTEAEDSGANVGKRIRGGHTG